VRISAGSIDTLASSWLLFVASAGVALLLGLAIASRGMHDLPTFAGALGMHAVTDGAIGAVIWLRERRLRLVGLVGAISIVSGLGALLCSENGHALLLVVALRALVMGGLQVAYARSMRGQRSALWLLLTGAVSAVIGLGFSVVSAFGYDALDLHYCIAGQLSIVGALLMVYALKLRALHVQQVRAFTNARPTH
jgi:uncharacterized membrane protein HdeD (DUF308 family)